ncbi:radical SAM protein [Desulfotomaculum copahuensis]|uniref:Radical SAM protein n=1 Tax=Desulfotomaculum copahuensis TaxID=1838280 RepID=A0A1B7LHK8_9FIRM|nr:radical SAM protein [Desulfotomaculum copahuensis]OAT85767.1 radical SAM protein [Desulfotomaculum copahuensis]
MSNEGLQSVKRIFSTKAMNWVVAYASREPDRNFPRVLGFLRTLARQDEHREMLDQITGYYQNNPAIHQFINRLLTGTNPNVKRRLVYNWFVDPIVRGADRETLSAKFGVHIPSAILVDPTSACNLHCAGCWAGKYAKADSISPARLDRLFEEAKELGVYWIVLSGGEPLIYPQLFDLIEKHPEITFMAYTNGTLIDEQMAGRMAAAGNFSPAISLEGWREGTDARRGKGVFDRVMRSMDLLRERGVIFGVSITITRHNVMEVTGDDFIDFLVEKGATYGWTFHYVPIGRNPDVNLMVTPEQRAYLAERIPYIRTHKPIQIGDFWNDGEITRGCIAGGREYFHINAAGEVEPCAFVHFAVDNINQKSLREVLASPLFEAYQKRQPFHGNYLRPCPIIDVPQALREIVAESGAHPTHAGAETVLAGTVACHLDERAAAWGKVADAVWQEKHAARKAGGM